MTAYLTDKLKHTFIKLSKQKCVKNTPDYFGTEIG